MVKLIIRRILLSIKENGFLWTYIAVLRRITPFWKHYLSKKMKMIESKKNILGLNSLKQNILTWNTYDWSKLGEEWSISKYWENKLDDVIIKRYILPNSIILEIGPGGGRWTKYLIKKSSKLILVDVSEKCLSICRKRFNEYNNIEYYLINEVQLDFLNDETIDFIFSYDVFIHIDPKDVEKYFKSFSRILKENGIIILHYSKKGEDYGNFFSRLNSKYVKFFAGKYNFEIICEYDCENFELCSINKMVNQVIAILKKK